MRMRMGDRLKFAALCGALLLCMANLAQAAEGPYGGTPAAVPGTVQAENYDTGGQGVAYSVASTNGTANSYRSDGIDLQATTDTGGGDDLGWTTSGQWFKYTVNVATAGTYTVTFRVASESAISDAFHVANASGTNLSGSIAVPNTGAWQTWTNVTAQVTLPAGQQTLTVDQDTAGWNLNWIAFAAGEGPYGGTAAAVPGTVQAENYDTGGQGVGYNVTSTNGSANGYRSDGIDLEATTDTGGGDDLGWTTTGQWFKYTVNVATAGTYTVTFRVASDSGTADAFYIANSSGTDLSGSVDVPNTGGWQTWTNVTATVTLPAGLQTLTVNQDNAGWNLNWISFTAASTGEAPYGGTAAPIPGTVQAENYDTGGQGVAYDITSTNGSANSYRSDGVDLETTSDTGGGYDLGWTIAPQWFKYTVNVATAGTYTVTFRVAAESAISDAFHISNSSGTNLSGSVAVPNTGGWETWANVTATVTLPAGQQTLTFNQDTAGWNLNYFSFASGSGGGVPGKLFAPFEYLGDLNDANQLPGIISASGVKAVVLAFLVPESNDCNLAWGGVNGALPDDTLGSTSIATEVSTLQSEGITVIISQGGAGGQDGSAYCSTAAATQALYQSVINKYHVTWLDFDLENPQTSGQPTRRAQALAALQQANPGLIISYTLPLGPGGLDSGDNGTTDLAAAASAGLNLGVVNGMAMDFGGTNENQPALSEEGAAALKSQIQSAGLTSTVGLTFLPGTSDDDPPQYFTLANATTMLNFAQANSYITMLSFWELNRDNGGCPGSTVDEDNCSGLTQSNYQFSSIFEPF
jgi:hypothetical protein